MLTPVLKKNDKQAKLLIYVVSFVVFAAVVVLSNFKLTFNLGFNPHIFALINAVINSVVAIMLVLALVAVKNKNFTAHKNLMLAAIVLSVLFLVSYILHHLLAGETKYGGVHDAKFYFYLIILFTHIALATVILPFVLFTAYRALTGEFDKHKKLAKYTWPLWFYVSFTGPLVYMLISPYYLPHL